MSKKSIEVTEENLRHYYIDLNTRLIDMPEIFGLSYNEIRTQLSKTGVKKTQKQAGSNIAQGHLNKDPNHFKKLSEKGRAVLTSEHYTQGGQTKTETTKAKHAEAGMTYDAVYDLYITQNNSLVKCAEHFNLTKSGFRSVLSVYEIVKDPAVAIKARKEGFAKLYSDPDRVAKMVAKTRETTLERYGNNWYHNTASKEEMAVKELIVERFPNLEVIQGSYGVIRRPGSGGLMQLDFHFPEIKLAVEYNGIYWHDKSAYLNDINNGTMNSREAIKDNLCQEEGIELIHVWSDDWKKNPTESFEKLAKAINKRISTSV